jgi:hypothetical protein
MGYKFPDGSLQTSAGQLNLPLTDTANAPEIAVFEIVGNSCQAAVRGKINFEGTFGELGASHFDAPDPFGVFGQTESGYGVMGRYTSNGRFGYLGGSQYAVFGQDADGTHRGHMGSNAAAVRGDYYHLGYGYNIYGILGNGAFGVYGNNPEGPGTSGYIASYNIAVAGINGDYVSGYLGDTQHNTMGYGVYGTHDIGNSGYLGGWFHGVYGQSVSGNIGYLAGFDNAVYGSSTSGFAAYFEGKGYFSNNLGIGTDTPAKPLHLVSEYDQPLLIESTDQYSGIELKDPTTTVTPKLMADGDHIYFQTDGTTRMKILSNGNVGINTSNPQATLHINDLMMLEPRVTAPASPQEGMIYYDDSTHKLRVYDGSTWQDCF